MLKTRRSKDRFKISNWLITVDSEVLVPPFGADLFYSVSLTVRKSRLRTASYKVI